MSIFEELHVQQAKGDHGVDYNSWVGAVSLLLSSVTHVRQIQVQFFFEKYEALIISTSGFPCEVISVFCCFVFHEISIFSTIGLCGVDWVYGL